MREAARFRFDHCSGRVTRLASVPAIGEVSGNSDNGWPLSDHWSLLIWLAGISKRSLSPVALYSASAASCCARL
jgi:hypothetical protein